MYRDPNAACVVPGRHIEDVFIPLTYRDLEEMMAERGLSIDHVTTFARDPGPIHSLMADNLSPGSPLVLSDAGLYSRASRCQPSGGSIGAIVGSCIEGNRRAWGSLMNSVDDDFE